MYLLVLSKTRRAVVVTRRSLHEELLPSNDRKSGHILKLNSLSPQAILAPKADISGY